MVHYTAKGIKHYGNNKHHINLRTTLETSFKCSGSVIV